MENKTFVPTAKGLVEYCKKMMTVPHLYVWGGNGEYVTTEFINFLAAKYPDWYTPEKTAVRLTLADKGLRGWDCFGLIKSYIWNDYNQNNTSGYNESFDESTKELFEWAEEKGTIDTLPEIPGICVWMRGHVGIYIGEGRVIDMTCAWHSVDITETVGGIQELPVEKGGWTHWLKCPYIEY